ncbi:MAG: hypothetical protein IRZ31_00075 [Thermogemmatispora sp.]|uniref:hypothetical protein n=1 Tax=Thermogemmatispora sp. TaxID=1968838 RepID=UPI0026383198|nr:hypothetical protein [Thermogemmatispora sp.]MBX5455268.1 hypothetical protein [Thermogemmatispora sp.]
MSQSSTDVPQFCGQCGHRLHSSGVCINPQCTLYNQRIVDQLGQPAASDLSTILQSHQTPLPPPAQSGEDQRSIPPPPPTMSWQAGATPTTPVLRGDQRTPPLPFTLPPSSSSPAPARQRQSRGLSIGLIVLLSLLLAISLIFNFIKVGGNAQTNKSTSFNTTTGTTGGSQGQGSTSPGELTPSSTTQPAPGTILCQADAAQGWNGWSGSNDWKVLNGQLLNDGTNDDDSLQPTIAAPCSLNGITNYAVEVTVQIIASNNTYNDGFGITVRGDPTQNPWRGYIAAVTYTDFDTNPYKALFAADSLDGGGGQTLAKVPFNPGNHSHLYRVEVKANSLKLLIDGGQELAVTDNRYLTTSQVGLSCYGFQLIITSFKVFSL